MSKSLLLAFGLIAAIPLIPVGADAQGGVQTSGTQTVAKYKIDAPKFITQK